MKEKETIEGYAYNKVRVTLDQNLTYRDEDVSLFKGNHGFPPSLMKIQLSWKLRHLGKSQTGFKLS